MKEILVGFDFSRHAQRALDLALEGLPFGLETNVTLLHVLDPSRYGAVLPRRPMPSVGEIDEFLRAEVEKATMGRPKRIHGEVRYLVATGGVVPDIAARMRSAAYDGLVIGAHGHGGFAERVLGTTGRRILRETFAPTYLVKNLHAMGPIARVLCAIDLSERSHAVLHAGSTLASRAGGSFDTFMVGLDEAWPYQYHLAGPTGDEMDALRATAQQSRQEAMRDLEQQVLGKVLSKAQTFAFGSPTKMICREAYNYDAVILGAHKGPFGSVLNGVLELSSTDVFVARESS